MRLYRVGPWFVAALFTVALPGGATPARPADPAPPPAASPADPRDTAPLLSASGARMLARAADASPTPSPNQARFDVGYYDLDLHLTPALIRIDGTVRTRARVLVGPLTSVELDLDDNMIVDATRAGGLSATFTHAANVITIALDRPYATGETFEVAVDYHGAPYGGWFVFHNRNGHPMIWNISEAFGARTWWPCKDYPEDKADSVDIRVALPTGLTVASNGTRVESTDDGTTAVSRWRERYPIATYLVSLAAHNYATFSDWYIPTPGDSMEIQFYMFSDQAASEMPVNVRVKDQIAVYSSLFGPYPFLNEKYGQAQYLLSGGMENQTCTTIGTVNEWVAAHELAHQWWGDMVTCNEFNHFWLNEGFATYAEGLWAESQSGPAALREDLSFNVYWGPGTVYIPDVSAVDPALEGALYYNRASWVLHMLRHLVGDSVFFSTLRAYGTAHRYGTVTTADFKSVSQATSGRDLNRFFQQWIYGEGAPAYRYDYTSSPGGGGYDLDLTIEQAQPGTPFAMPLDVRISTAGGPVTFVAADSLPTQSFLFHVDAAPTAVALDPDDWVLGSSEQPVVDPTFDRGVLLVNGLSFGVDESELRSSYEDRAFWGDYPIDFWDVFDSPSGGYPSTLPTPLGHGVPPRELLGHYRNVIWVGGHSGGDLYTWLHAPIPSYLQAGGNVILMTRLGDQYLAAWHRDYLGVSWVPGSSIYDHVALWPGLTNIGRLGPMNSCTPFDMALGRSDSHLLYKADFNYNPDRGDGVWRKPDGGGTHRLDGGQFIFLSGVPYRWNHADLRTNLSTMLGSLFGEPVAPSGVPEEPGVPSALALGAIRPNPVQDVARFDITLPGRMPVRVELFDVRGARVRRLLEESLPAGRHEMTWDGRDDRGNAAPAGVYWLRLESGDRKFVRKLTKIR